MGLFDDVTCQVPLPDGWDAASARLQTKSFPDPCMQHYTITAGGRLVDRDGNDVEPEGYICFYGSVAGKGGKRHLREYRARFRKGQLTEIVRAKRTSRHDRYYGLASFKWFRARPRKMDWRGIKLLLKRTKARSA